MLNKLYFVILLFVVGAGQILAQTNNNTSNEVMELSLQEAQQYAIQHNYNALIAREGIEQAKGQVKEVKAMGLPQLNGTVSYSYNLKLPAQLVPSDAFGFPDTLYVAEGGVLPGVGQTSDVGFLPMVQAPEGAVPEFQKLTFGTKHNFNAGIQLSQLVFDGSYLLGLEAARKFEERARKQTLQTEVDIKNQVAEAYFSGLIVQQNLDLLRKNIKTLERVLFETNELYKNGFTEELEVDRLKLSIANLNTQVDNMQRQIKLMHNVLKFQIGLDLDTPIKLTDTLEDYIADAENELSVDISALQSQALSSRVELQLTEMQNVFRELDIKQVKAQYLPNVGAFWSFQYAFQRDNLNIFKGESWIPSSIIGLQVNVPIFDGFMKKGQLEQRLSTQKQAFYQHDLAKQAIKLEVRNAQEAYLNAYSLLQNQKNNLTLAEKIYNVTLIKYKEGVGSSLEVMQAETELNETQGLYINALYDLVVAKTTLDIALGKY